MESISFENRWPMTSTAKRPCCPHLGLQHDRPLMLMGPTMAHRCYVQTEALLPDLERQSQFCLGANHTQCPLYTPPTNGPFASAHDEQDHQAAYARTLTPVTTPSTQLVLVRQPPVRHPNANRILLARHHPAPLAHRQPRPPLLLPAVSSYSAQQIHRWSFFSTKVTIAATLMLIVFTLSSSLLMHPQTRGEGSYQAGGVIAQESIPFPTATKSPATAAVAVVIQDAVNASPTLPPTPTQLFLAATPTHVLTNGRMAITNQDTTSVVAAPTRTYTLVSDQVGTPTPFPANLATVQANALVRGLPSVLLYTATPSSLAQATGNAQYATAVALTTGTFTPIPTDFVTPVLIMPSPPAENIATAAARAVEATTVAASGADTPTALPYNALIAQYIYATPSPQNEVTAVAQSVIATANALLNGTPTSLPWNAVVITAVPTPQPSSQPVSDFIPTATPTGDVMPALYHNKILFKTNRNGAEETYALEPASGEVFRVSEPWVHTLAFQQLALAPDHNNAAVVIPDGSGVLQIQIQMFQYGTIRQLTAFKSMSYDPAWSPQGDRIAFVGTDAGNDEIYLVSIDGSVVQQLTSNNLWDKHPSWSPDSSQIVFYSNREGDRRQLWIMNADGSGQRNLSNNAYEDWDPIWVP